MSLGSHSINKRVAGRDRQVGRWKRDRQPNRESLERMRERERERVIGLLLPSIGFRGRKFASLFAALGPLACLAAVLGRLA